MSRLILCMSWGEDRASLPAAVPGDRIWAFGGERTMYELAAAAAAAAGVRVEVRGNCLPHVAREVAAAAGVEVAFPAEPTEARPDDVVVISEGHADVRFFAGRLRSPSRNVLLLLAPPGLFGWDFTADWQPRDVLDVDPDEVGTPAQIAAAAELGFELWTNNPHIAAAAAAGGAACHDIGNGWPVAPADAPVAKTADVAVVADNRWAQLAERAVAGLDAVDRIPGLEHGAVLERIAAARVLVHVPRVEGGSRIAAEARALGTVPVGLASNRFAVGLREELGGLAVGAVEDLAPAVRRLLADPARLRRLADAGRDTARTSRHWPAYVTRVRHALDHPPRTRHAARGALGRARHAA